MRGAVTALTSGDGDHAAAVTDGEAAWAGRSLVGGARSQKRPEARE